jgi:hypothetical protein
LNARIARLLALLGVTSHADNDDSALDAACAAVQQRKDAGDQTTAVHKAALDAVTAQRDAEKVRADKAEAEVARLKAAETARQDGEARKGLETAAQQLGVDPTKHAAIKDLRRAVAAAYLAPAELKADASDDYVAAIAELAVSKGQPAAEDRHQDGRRAGSEAWSADRQRSDADRRESKRRMGPGERALASYREAFEAAHGGEG